MPHLLFHETIHIIAAFAGVLIFRFYFNESRYSLLLLVASMLIDADHLVDYTLYLFQNHTWPALSDIPGGHYFNVNGKIMVPVHSWELVVSLFLFYKKSRPSRHAPVALALALGFFVHLIVDQLTNDVTLPAYSLIYRIAVGFNIAYIGTG